MAENCCSDVCFTEMEYCYREGDYLKAHGWTESTGQSGMFPYTPPAGWEYDPAFEDIRDPILGSHGGCPNCTMTLVHLQKIAPSRPSKSKLILLVLLIIGQYIYRRYYRR